MSATVDLMAGLKEMKDAEAAYIKAEQYFLGTRAEYFASQRYRIALLNTGTTYRMNFAKTPVTAVVDRVEMSSIHGNDPDTTQLLRTIWNDNQMDIEVPDVHLKASEFGDAYLFVWNGEDGGIESDEDEVDNSTFSGSATVEMYYNDPRVMRIIYDPENPRRPLFVIKRWQVTGQNVFRVNLYYRDRFEKWTTMQNATEDNPASWVQYDDGTGEWPIENPYNRLPVFHFRTSRPYGIPVHYEAYGPQDIITKIIITHMTTMDYHGYPQRWAISGGDLADGDDEDFSYDQDVDGVEVTTGPSDRSSLRGGPGELWLMKNVKSIGQFDAATSDVFLKPFVTYVQGMAQTTTTPLHYFDQYADSPSGESLRVAEAPFVKKVDRLKMLWGSTWQDVGDFALMIATGDDHTGETKVTWKSSAAANDQLAWELALMKRDLGVPVWQVLLEQGYTEDQLRAWKVPDPVYVIPAELPAPPLLKTLPPTAKPGVLG